MQKAIVSASEMIASALADAFESILLHILGMPGEAPRVFYEQMKFQRYDISEMSMSSYLRMRAVGRPYRALPVFHNRAFSYTAIDICSSSGIRQDHPEDLKGKRVGIRDYQQSVGLWTRGILKQEYGINPEDMIWYQERGEHFSHTGASAQAGLALPANVELHHTKTDISTMFLRGELDAAVSLSLVVGRLLESGIDRKQADLSRKKDIVTLFSDPRREAIRYFQKTGVYPPHHTTVIRESIVKEHPWVAVSLMEAFEESKKIAMERLRRLPPALLVFGKYYIRALNEIFGPDPFPYGVKANSKAFDMVQTFSVEQGLTEQKQPWDDIFPLEIMYREERL